MEDITVWFYLSHYSFIQSIKMKISNLTQEMKNKNKVLRVR